MKLHRLTMTAIGPFAQTMNIDFSELGEGGLFLLEGPTGSGKSTILDAISFALYGKVAQSDGAAERLRSHHASPQSEPVVELVFETQSGIFRVRRTPSFDRPKKKGDGTARVNATVKIWRLTSPDGAAADEPLSTRISEADDEITRAIGLSHDQFMQTVLLPQGEFANFLRAKTDDKKALLHKLFGTELIARTQEQLVERRREAEQRRQAAAAAIGAAARTFVGATGADDLSGFDTCVAEGDTEKLAHLVEQSLNRLTAEAAGTSQRHERAASEHAVALEAMTSGRELHDRAARLNRLRAQLHQLEADSAVVEAARAELGNAEHAALVVPFAQALRTATNRVDAEQARAATACAELPPELRQATEAELREAASARTELLGSLAEVLDCEQALDDLAREQAGLQEQISRDATALAAAKTRHERLPIMLAGLSSEREAAVLGAANLAAFSAEHERATSRLLAAQRAATAAVVLSRDAQITQTAAEAWASQEERLAALRVTWRAGVAGELGMALVAGEECLVCGSVEHPRPAGRRPGQVTQDDLDRAEQECTRLRAAAQGARDELLDQERQLADLQSAADQLSPDQARSKLEQVETAIEAARAAEAEAERLTSLIAATQAELDELAALLTETGARLASLTERASLRSNQLIRDRERVDAARAEFATVAERIDALTYEKRVIATAAATLAAVQVAVDRALESGTAYATALAESCFSDEGECLAAVRDAATMTELRRAIRSHEEAHATVRSQLAEPALNDPVLQHELPDLETLAAAVTAARDAEEAAAREDGSSRSRLATASTRSQAVLAAIADSSAVLSETAAAIRLGNLAAGLGENQYRIDLTTFVLVRRFADVLAAANGQLRRISGGRYVLEHTDARTGNARSGLSLRVLDLHTGRPRDPGTLSGGETFYVSLSLALGLADVVRSESGGVDLGTLFIDEGFGSLDPEVLDEVLETLDRLRAGGRVVGVVSHVAELKGRIAERIEVRRNADGSSRLRVVA